MDGDVKLPFHAVSDIKRRINALTCLISLTGMVGLVTAGLCLVVQFFTVQVFRPFEKSCR